MDYFKKIKFDVDISESRNVRGYLKSAGIGQYSPDILMTPFPVIILAGLVCMIFFGFLAFLMFFAFCVLVSLCPCVFKSFKPLVSLCPCVFKPFKPFVSLCLCALVSLCPCASAQSLPQVCFHEACFSVEIADEPAEQRRGLMFRRDLAPDHGMLFVFEREARYGFWMKNTLIPLDMIWLDSKKQVVFIQENAVPCPAEACESYQPSKAARYVLELNAGTARQIGLNIGDQMRFECVEAEAGLEKF